MKIALTLIHHGWLRFIRARGLGHRILEKVLLLIILLNVAVSLAVAGLVSGTLIDQLYPGKDPAQMALGLLVLYFFVELLMRYVLQKFPVGHIAPYFSLPISRSSLSFSLLISSLFSPWNAMVWFFAIPMYYSALSGQGGVGFALAFFLSVAAMSLLCHFSAFAMVARRTGKLPVLLGAAMLSTALYFEFQGQLHMAEGLGGALGYMLSSNGLWLVLLALPIVMVAALHRYLVSNLGLEHVARFERGLRFDSRLGLFGKYGAIGELIDLEFRLVLRNKRARQYFLMSTLFWLLPIWILKDSTDMSVPLALGLAFVTTGMITLNHAQLTLSWNSLHFDFLLSRSKTVYQVFLAKYYAMVFFCLLGAVLTLPYGFWAPNYVPAVFAMLSINATISIYVYMLVAAISSLRVEPNEGSAMSMSGFGVVHYVIVLPIIAVPALLYAVGYFLAGELAGMGFVALLGVLLFALHKPIVKLITKIFIGNRYRIAATLRNK